jgi:hypothetical protein
MELLIIFLITLLVTLTLVFALLFGKAPTYRPSRERVIELLESVLSGQAQPSQWDLFIGMPIQHDELLEQTRVRAVMLHEGLNGVARAREGIDGYIYDRAGREQIAELLSELKFAIQNEPVTREF